MSAWAWLGTNRHENPDSMKTWRRVSAASAGKTIQSATERALVTFEPICLSAAHIHQWLMGIKSNQVRFSSTLTTGLRWRVKMRRCSGILIYTQSLIGCVQSEIAAHFYSPTVRNCPDYRWLSSSTGRFPTSCFEFLTNKMSKDYVLWKNNHTTYILYPAFSEAVIE